MSCFSQHRLFPPILLGYYCDASTLANATAPCDPGFFCVLGAKVSNPRDNKTGNVCPKGRYCERGTYSPTPCPEGTFSNSTENKNVSDCSPCLAGYYCGSQGLDGPTNECDGGYYCPPGQSSSRPTNFECTPGHYCPPGSPIQLTCESGSYQDEYKGSSCKECPEGYYCDATLINVTHCVHGVQLPSPCVPGHFCLNGTKSAKQHPCPAGMWNIASSCFRKRLTSV